MFVVLEDILALYTQPEDPQNPVICRDEVPKQLLSDIQEPLPAELELPGWIDYAYQRHGVVNLYMFFAPFLGQRHIKVTDSRTRLDWDLALRELSDEIYPEAEKIIMVLDNLNIHTPAAFYLALEPEEARRLGDCFKFHFTPKHGSWLNMAEIELSVLSRQCIKQRIPDPETLQQKVQAWLKDRNAKFVKVDWRFSTAYVRKKLKRLYPKIHD